MAPGWQQSLTVSFDLFKSAGGSEALQLSLGVRAEVRYVHSITGFAMT